MSVIFIILPIALVMATLFVVAFLLSVKSGQFDDLDTPAYRSMFDDDALNRANKKKTLEPQMHTDGHG